VFEEPAVDNLALAEPETSVLVCEKSPFQAELLMNALQSIKAGMRLKCARNVDDAAAQISSDKVHVTLMSSLECAPVADHFYPLRILHERFPSMPIVFLADTCTASHVVEAFRIGVRGVAYRDESFTTLVSCIEQVGSGQMWVGERELQFILKALRTAVTFEIHNAMGNELLTPREQQVAMLVAEGMSNREVSLHLGISEHTVKNYMFHIFDKLGISNRVELVRYAQSQLAAA
jgi:DNA-binding NarL/FixJ family response regulator